MSYFIQEIYSYKGITIVLDSKCVESKRKTPTLGRYERHTTLADKSNSIGTSKAWNSQRSSFAEEYHPVKLYETPVTISFVVNEGEDIQQKRY